MATIQISHKIGTTSCLSMKYLEYARLKIIQCSFVSFFSLLISSQYLCVFGESGGGGNVRHKYRQINGGAKIDGGAGHKHEKYGRFVPTGKCHHLHAGHCSFPLDYVLSLVLLTVSIIVVIVIIIIIATFTFAFTSASSSS